MSLSITGNVIEDENLGLTTLATDSDNTDPDNNVLLSTFQTSIPKSSSLGTELTALNIYPDTTSGTGTAAAIGIADNAIVSSDLSNLVFGDSSGKPLSGVDTHFTAIDGAEIFLYSDPSNPDIVLGREGSGGVANPNGKVAFALLLQPTSGGATVWVVQYEALTNTNPSVGEDANTLNLDQLVYVSGSSTTTSNFNFATKQPGQNYWLPFHDAVSGDTVLVTGLDKSTSSPDTVNTSTVGLGSDSQAITPGRALRFDFVSSYTGGGTKDSAFLTDGSLNSLAYVQGNQGSFDISQTNPTHSAVNVKIIAQNEPTNATIFDTSETDTSANLVQITRIVISGTQSADSNTGNASGVTFVKSGGLLTGEVDGLKTGDKITFYTGSNTFDQFVVGNITNTTFGVAAKGTGFDILNASQTLVQTNTTSTEVGSHLIFEDSVPNASANTQTATVDEDALVGVDPGETNFSGSATGNVSNLFNPGTDTPLTYRLSVDTSSLPTDLKSGGTTVTYLVTSATDLSGVTTDTLTASANSTTVFTLSLVENGANAGNYTFTLLASIDNETPQNGTPEGTFSIDVSKLVQATDADGNFAAGDTATAAANALKLKIIDDQPAATANTSSKTVQEDALSTNSANNLDPAGATATASDSVASLFTAGADVPLSFTLSTDTSSLTSQNLKSGGTALFYSVSSDHTTLTAAKGSGGPTVFTLTLDTSGNWNFTLSAPIDHAPGASDSSNTTIDFSSILQASDYDGSGVSAAAKAWTVKVVDDVPENFTPSAITSADNFLDEAGQSPITKDLTDDTTDPYPTLAIDQHAGADGFGALSFVGTNGVQLTGQLDGGSSTNLQAGGKDIYLFGFGTGTLTATTDSTGAGLPGGGGGSLNTADEVFTISLNHASDQYTFDLLQAIGNGSRTLFSDFADVPAGDYAWFSLPFNPTTKQPVTPGMSVVFTGKTAGTDTVNPSSIGTGTDAQSVKDGNAIRIDFVNDVHSINTTNDLKSISTLGYAGHYQVNDSGFTLAQVNGSGGPNATVDIRLDAYDITQGSLAQGGTFPSDSNQDAITEVKLVTFDSSGKETVLADFTGNSTKSITSGGKTESVTVNFDPTGDSNGVDVEGLKYIPGVYILASTADGFDRLVTTNVDTSYNNAGHSFDVGPVSAGTFVAGSDVNMSFNLALQDYDAFASNSNVDASGNLIEASTGTLNVKLTAPTV
ncbi:hypothetical protein EN852_026735 [Mesorhizobium sp. M2E.F.Ca.ET.209.01.1.1]|uniref:beta strand repeat-containing protein n=1 Tax=Mesorhizobium sp. M2E.F.Ca.ET.209.01.1.1 TaxID=2500526 RepID=UPI000FDAE39D|nr:hypothetical protein [Mesorhizobium sp. M2E.F.Ca.ET.209.01.1.1]TGS10273.1 hypothetical protein EN852_026735 [Mesorhizobium sp. M2E.F.Ca.ET.209.01.1.1]